MLRFVLFVTALIIGGYLMIQEDWTISITAFGYEVTLSVVLLVLMLLFVYYMLHLIKQPFVWLFKIPERRHRKRQMKKESFLTFVLQTVLDKNDESIATILSKKQSFLAKDDIKHLLLTALFKPERSVFEQLATHTQTALAGWRGLLDEALATGDVRTAEKVLALAMQSYPKVGWILTEQLRLQVLQNDWVGVLATLDALKKAKRIDKDVYDRQRAAALFKLGRVKESFDLDKSNPAIAIAYAKREPKKAAVILEKAWRLTPCHDIYVAYLALFADEMPARRVKAVERLVSSNPAAKPSLIALADSTMAAQMWGVAKEYLDVYLEAYPLTGRVAQMMADVERGGWHHEAEAKSWEEKAKTAPQSPDGWMCVNCQHTTTEWDATCPHCNAFCGIVVQ